MDPNSLNRNILNTFGKSAAEAFISAFFWALLWIFIFMVTNGIVQLYLMAGDSASEMSAAALTVAVIANSFPKLLSYFLNSDTDLRGIYKEIDLKRVRLNRLVLCSLIISFAIYILVSNIDNGVNQFQIFSIDFFAETVEWGLLVFVLFFNQIVFSWPDAGNLAST